MFTIHAYMRIALVILLIPISAEAEGLPDLVPSGLGVSSHFVVPPKNNELQLLNDSGIRIARTSLDWHRVEKAKGIYDFGSYLHLTDSLASKGIRPLFVLAYGNPIYDNSAWPHHDGIASAEVRDAFAGYASAAAEAFKGREVLWEIWNEPNLRRFWRSSPSAREYLNLVKAAVPVIRKADPHSIIIAPSLASGPNIRGYLAYLEDCFRHGLLELVDAVSVHPYRQENPETATSFYKNIRKLIIMYAPAGKEDLPIVSTEWGYSLSKISAREQSDYVTRMYLVNLVSGVPLTIWYEWRDGGNDPNNREHNFGLLRRDYSPKPAYHALIEMNRELDGYRFVQRLPVPESEDWVLLFEKAGRLKLVAWTEGSPHYLEWGPLTPASTPIELEVTSTPLYLAIQETSNVDGGRD